MKRLLCLLSALALLAPLCAAAEESPAAAMEGEWRAITLYSEYHLPFLLDEAGMRELPELLAMVFALEEPTLTRLTDEIFLVYGRPDGTVLVLKPVPEEEGVWHCYPSIGNDAMGLRDGQMVDHQSGLTLAYTLEGDTLTLSPGTMGLASGAQSRTVRLVSYSADCFELHETDEARTLAEDGGVSWLLFVRQDAMDETQKGVIP